MGNYHVRFLGEGAAAMPLPYPTTRRARNASSERRAEGRSSCTEAVAERTCKQENVQKRIHLAQPYSFIHSRAVDRVLGLVFTSILD
jgi:hypothetical protein